MMKPALFLRIAAVLTFIHAVLHTIGGVFGKPGPDPATVFVATKSPAAADTAMAQQT